MSVLFVCVGVVLLSLFAVLSCLLSLLLVLRAQGERKGNGEKAQPSVFLNTTHTTRTEEREEEESLFRKSAVCTRREGTCLESRERVISKYLFLFLIYLLSLTQALLSNYDEGTLLNTVLPHAPHLPCSFIPQHFSYCFLCFSFSPP